MAKDLPPLNLLVAYNFMNRAALELVGRLERLAGVRLFVDSGAFSAWKAGKSIKLDDYCAFLRDLPVKPWRYITLDVVGDAKASERNYQTMLDRGFRPVPVFTRGAPLDELDRYYQTSDLVAVGGLVSRVNDPRRYLRHLAEHLHGRPYHLLGFSQLDWLKFLKPYSVDSSSWDRSRRFGTLDLYMGRGRMLSINYKRFLKHGRDEEVASRVRMLGFDLARYFRPDAWRGSTSVTPQLSAASWMWFALDMERRFGTRFFLAHSCSSSGPYLPEMYARALRAAGYQVPDDGLRRTA